MKNVQNKIMKIKNTEKESQKIAMELLFYSQHNSHLLDLALE